MSTDVIKNTHSAQQSRPDASSMPGPNAYVAIHRLFKEVDGEKQQYLSTALLSPRGAIKLANQASCQLEILSSSASSRQGVFSRFPESQLDAFLDDMPFSTAFYNYWDPRTPMPHDVKTAGFSKVVECYLKTYSRLGTQVTTRCQGAGLDAIWLSVSRALEYVPFIAPSSNYPYCLCPKTCQRPVPNSNPSL